MVRLSTIRDLIDFYIAQKGDKNVTSIGTVQGGGTISNMIYIFMTSIKEMSNPIRIREKTIFLCIKKVMISA
mgnify:CR=1 FL=1